MKKTVFACLAVLCIGFSVSACGGNGNATDSSFSSSISANDNAENSSSLDSAENSSPEAKTPYTITYHLGDFENDPLAYITAKTQTVYYGDTLQLYTPNRYGYQFVCWRVQGQSSPYQATTYTFEGNITLVATWAENLNSSNDWTENG